jgi:transposase
MKYTMSMKEPARLAVIKGAVDGAYTVKQAARKLGASTRQIKRLKKDVREQGGGAVIHGNPGRHPANVTSEAVRAKITALKKSGPYRQTNFTRFRELLEEYEQITISYTSLSRILKEAGIASPGTRRSGGERQSLANWYKRTPRRMTGSAPRFNMPCTGFRMAPQETYWDCTCANTSARRGILRRFGRF